MLGENIDPYPYLARLSAFDAYLRFNELYNSKRITSGVYMCAIAAAIGYRKIYVAGIDFYQGDKTSYVFEHKKHNILQLLPDFNKSINQAAEHNIETDLEALAFLQQHYDVEIYSIAPTSPFSQYFPLAETQNSSLFTAIKKQDYTHDIMLPEKFVYQKLGIEKPKSKLHSNLIFRLVRDLLRLPSAVKHYFKLKRQPQDPRF